VLWDRMIRGGVDAVEREVLVQIRDEIQIRLVSSLRLRGFPLRSQSGLPDLRHPCSRSAQSHELTRLDPRCQFDPSDDHRGSAEALPPQHGTQPLFPSAMVLLHDVVPILTAAHFHSLR